MRKLFFATKRTTYRFAKKHAKWLLPAIGLVSMVSILAVAANIPVPAGSASRFVPGVPTAPVITAIASQDQQLSVTFTAAGANGGTISMYQYSTDNGATWKNRASGTTASPLVITTVSGGSSGLVNGTSYQVRLRAVSNIGQGLASNMIVGIPAAVPDAPTIQSSEANFTSIELVYDAEVQDDGKILVGGDLTYFEDIPGTSLDTNNLEMVRLNRDGTIDNTFMRGLPEGTGFYKVVSGAVQNATVRDISIAPDGKIYVGGDFNCWGDPTWNSPTACASSNTVVNGIVRLNANGTLDTTFAVGANTGATGGIVNAVQALPDGGVVIGGAFTTVNNVALPRLAVLNSNGTTNTNFNSGGSGVNNSSVLSVTVDPLTLDIYAGGTFTQVNGVTTNYQYLTKFASSGTSTISWSLDTSFSPRPNTSVYDLKWTPDGRYLYAGGAFSSLSPNGGSAQTRNSQLARFTRAGSLDSWNPSITVSGSFDLVMSLSLQQDGNLLVGGYFTSPAVGIFRVNVSTAALDSSFSGSVSGGGAGVLEAIELPFGEIYVGGSFTSLSGISRANSGILESTGPIEDGVTWRYNGSTNTDGSAYVRFAAPVSAGGAGVSLQNYQYSTDNGSTWTAFSPAVTTATNVTISGLTNGTASTLRLRAKNTLNDTQGTNSNGYGAASNSAAGTICSVPSAPTFALTTPAPSDFERARGFTYSTAPSATANGCTITRYEYASSVSASTPSIFVGEWSSTTPKGVTTNTGVGTFFLTGTAYKVRLRAVNAAGAGTASSDSTVTTMDFVTCVESGVDYCHETTGGTFSILAISSTTSNPIVNANLSISGVVIGGGGSGGALSASTNAGGGGGAGGFTEASVDTVSGRTLSVTVGAGASGTINAMGSLGGFSLVTDSVVAISATGGGAGGGTNASTPGVGGNGGSGGGGASSTGSGTFAGGSAESGQGNAGGSGPRAESVNQRIGGGGGGKNAAGTNGATKASTPYLTTGGGGGACQLPVLVLAWDPADLKGYAAGGGGADTQLQTGTGVGGSCRSTQVGGSRSTTATGNGQAPAIQWYNLGLGKGQIFGTGSGGGAARGGGTTTGAGGAGSKGVVILYWITAR
jgi:uncharacterized delta-60 repeat protein